MIIHVVQTGETIFSIAKSYGLTAEKLIQDNELTNPNNLVIGQAIVIVYPRQTYTVQEGDTLESIANAYGVTQVQLLRNNPMISERNILYPGETIVIDYEGEKIGDISTNGYAYPYIDQDRLRKVLPYLTYLTLFTYGLTPEGDLIQIDDTEIIQLAREYGVAPLMLISTYLSVGVYNNELTHAILSNKDIQNYLINNIIDNMKAKDYFGLYINFGFILIEDRQAYADFMTELSKRLADEGFEVCVALAPDTISKSGVIYEGHDYAGLGQSTTAVLLMTYEWGYTLGPSMSIAPIDYMRAVFDYSVTKIPPEKTYIGIPTYGYDWVLDPVKGAAIPHSLSNVAAIDLAVQVGAVIEYDEVSQAPFYYYTDTYGGKDKHHIVWFEDARSIDAKVKLVPEYGFRGISILNVMNYFAQLWLVINTQYEIRKAI
jgi:spore germination protein